jgi:hypothetical protein
LPRVFPVSQKLLGAEVEQHWGKLGVCLYDLGVFGAM